MKFTHSIGRTIGVGILALTTLVSMSVMTLAADNDSNKEEAQNVTYSISAVKAGQEIGTGEVSNIDIKSAEDGKSLYSTDGGKTWQEMNVEEMNVDGIELDNEFATATVASSVALQATDMETKLDEETGKVLYSTDDGETWQEFEIDNDLVTVSQYALVTEAVE